MPYYTLTVILAVVLIAIIIIRFISTKNNFNILLRKINDSAFEIESVIIKRYGIFDKTREYLRKEIGDLPDTVTLRPDMDISEKIELNRRINEAIEKLLLIAGEHPELLSSECYSDLQNSDAESEKQLQTATRIYNMNILSFNRAIAEFPANIVAGIANYKPKQFFELL